LGEGRVRDSDARKDPALPPPAPQFPPGGRGSKVESTRIAVHVVSS
jgi:hypothetical protein